VQAILVVVVTLLIVSCSEKDADNNLKGREALDKKDYDLAIACFDEAIRINPRNANAYNNRGCAYGAKRDSKAAIEDFSNAIRINPKSSFAFTRRGATYQIIGENDKAIADLSEAILLNPKDPFAYGWRGNTYVKVKNYTMALSDFNAAIQADPNSVSAYNALAWFLATCSQADLRDGKKAVLLAKKANALTTSPDGACMDTLAAAYAESGDFEKAISWESKCLEAPNISEKTASEVKSRLLLYQSHQPYHQ
jgi:tetratricopeptide (TPR) repeat protein